MRDVNAFGRTSGGADCRRHGPQSRGRVGRVWTKPDRIVRIDGWGEGKLDVGLERARAVVHRDL